MRGVSASAAPRPVGAPWWLLALGAALCAGYLIVEARLLGGVSGLPLDDSWIHLAFARNLAAGQGLSLNSGELVTGSTAPLWTALESLVLLLPGAPAVWVKLVGILFYLAGVDATWRLARELELPAGLAALATVLAMGSGWLIWSALSGLEIPLFVALGLWGVLLHVRRRADGGSAAALAVLAAAALARPEGLLLLALAVCDGVLATGIAGWRRQLPGVGLALVLLLPVGLFNLVVGGSPLPSTFAAKAGGSRDWLPDMKHLFSILGILFKAQPWSVLLAAAGTLELARRLRTARDRGLLPALWLLALPLAYASLSPDHQVVAGNFGRYYFPLFPFLAVVGALGLAPLAERLGPATGWRPGGRMLATAGLALLLLPTLSSTVQGAGRYVQSVANVEQSDVAMARWLEGRLPAEAVLAVNDIGAFKYLLPNRVIDLVGIVSPDARRQAERRVAEGVPFYDAMAEILEAERPDYVVVFPTWLPGIERDERFTPLVSLVIPDNRTMGGDEIVLYATPWTRYPLREPAGAGDVPGDPTPPGRGSQEER